MESPAEITSDQADQTKHASREGEKTGQNKLPSVFSSSSAFSTDSTECFGNLSRDYSLLVPENVMRFISKMCVCVSSSEAPMHGDKKQNEPSVSPKRSASGDTDDSIPAKRPRAQEEISSEQVRLDALPPKKSALY